MVSFFIANRANILYKKNNLFSNIYFMDLNRSQVLGRVTQDPELRQTPSGQSVVSFSVATNRTWKDASGEQKEQAEFHNIVAWGKLAEIVGNYCKKGGRVFVEGRLQTRSWEDNEAKKHWKTEIVADNVILLDSKSVKSGNDGDDLPAEHVSRKSGEDISIEEVPF